MASITTKKGELLENKTRVVSAQNEEITIDYLISDEGGQGDVYHATFRGQPYALKWYKNPGDVIGSEQYETILGICGAENCPCELFIWPLFLATEENPSDGKRFGYLMKLLPQNYFEMEDFLRKDGDPKAVRFTSYNSMLVAGMNIATAMRKLHLRGKSYKDLNPKNFMFRPDTGDVLVVDNDNVSIDGGKCSVKGMKGYMAPEIPRSKYRLSPSRYTDYYSLAVILYRLLCVDHPMEGALWEKAEICTDKVEEYLYSLKPIFHFDPDNTKNRPTDIYAPNASARWNVLPQEIKDLFVFSFTEGLYHSEKRYPENKWIKSFAKFRDSLIRMNVHGHLVEQLVDFENHRNFPPLCLGMKIGGNKIALYPSKAIYQISVDGNDNEYLKMVAGIAYNKNLRSLMLCNMTKTDVWKGWSPKTDKVTEISPGSQYPIYPGVIIEFQNGLRPRTAKITGAVFDPVSDR